MYIEDISADIILLFMLYGGAAMASLIACIYLLLCKGNAFNTHITPPVRLRRWAAALFAVTFLGHIWWLLLYFSSGDLYSVSCVTATLLDCVALIITIPGTMLAMLQDRKRSVWSVVIAAIPFAIFEVLNIVNPDGHFQTIAVVYFLLLYVIFTIYMVFAMRQYGRWLRDNYADLENKEVLLSQVLIIAFFLLIMIYGFDSGNLIIGYLVQAIQVVLLGFLLWRIETLPQLENVTVEQPEEQPEPQAQLSPAFFSNIEQLLDERCVATHLYLQHDLTLLLLAQILGTNRSYLSQYFSHQGITYNAYINNLRIDHFMKLYREAVSSDKTITAQQLAKDSGFRSYSTFSLAFKQRMGQSVTAWMQEM